MFAHRAPLDWVKVHLRTPSNAFMHSGHHYIGIYNGDPITHMHIYREPVTYTFTWGLHHIHVYQRILASGDPIKQDVTYVCIWDPHSCAHIDSNKHMYMGTSSYMYAQGSYITCAYNFSFVHLPLRTLLCSPREYIHMYTGIHYIRMYGEPIMCTRALLHMTMGSHRDSCAYRGISHLHSETRTCMYTHIPLKHLCMQRPYHHTCIHRVLSHVHTETPFTYMHIEALSYICTQESHHMCVHDPCPMCVHRGPIN